MVSVAIYKMGLVVVFFLDLNVNPNDQVNGKYYCNVPLSQHE